MAWGHGEPKAGKPASSGLEPFLAKELDIGAYASVGTQSHGGHTDWQLYRKGADGRVRQIPDGKVHLPK